MKKYLIASMLLFSVALASPLVAQAAPLIKQGSVLAWSASSGQNGSLTISNVKGQYFEADQVNEKNQGAGKVKLYGAQLDNGNKIVMINIGSWKEVWEGAVSGTEINGSLTNGSSKYTFKITAAEPQSSTAPFINGKTLKWESGAGQNGTILVTSVTGLKFTLDQSNVKNKAAGIIKLEGEIKGGKVFIYNKKWNETWTGTNTNNVVTGTINGGTSFKIFE